MPPLATSSQPSSASPRAKLVEAGLVVDGDQRAHSSSPPSAAAGARPPGSAACERLARVAGRDRHALLREHRARCRRPRRRGAPSRRVSVAPAASCVLDRVRAREGRQQRRVDVDDPLAGSGRGTTASAGACSRRDDELDAVLARASRPSRRRAPRGRRSSSSVEDRRSGCPAAAARSSARRVGAVRRDAAIGRPASISACRFVPLPLTSTPITRLRPITSSSPGCRLGDDRAEADPEVEDAPQLVLVDVPREPVEDRRPLPRVPVDRARAARPGRTRREVAEDAAAGHVRERLRARRAARERRRGRGAVGASRSAPS